MRWVKNWVAEVLASGCNFFGEVGHVRGKSRRERERERVSQALIEVPDTKSEVEIVREVFGV